MEMFIMKKDLLIALVNKCDIRENSKLFNVIMDKNVVVDKDKQLIGDEEFPLVIEKRALF